MTPTRLLVVIHGPAFGGAHNQIVRLREPLAERGIEAVAALPDGAEAAAARMRDCGLEVLEVPLGRLRADPNPVVQGRFLASLGPDVGRLRQLIARRQIDVVQAHGATNPHAAIAANLEGAAVVWQLFDTRAPMVLRRLAMPLVVRLADSMTVWGRALVTAHPGAEKLGDRVVTVYPPLDIRAVIPDPEARERARSTLGVPPGVPLIGTLGVLNPQKGHRDLLSAAALLAEARPDLHVRIFGSTSPGHPDHGRELHAYARALGLGPRQAEIVEPGPAPVDRLHALDVFVMTSVPRSEGMPTAILEAMACAKPVVSTRVGAVAELVEDGNSGILVPPEDPASIAAAIGRLLDHEDLRRRMGDAGRRRAEEGFNLDRLADLHAHAFEIARRHGHASRNSRSRRSRRRRHRRRRGLSKQGAAIQEGEREFFDSSVAELDAAAMPPREYAPYDSRFEDAILEAVGDIRGASVLDLGCGAGDLTLRLLDRGAAVTGVDVSTASLDVARQRVELFRPGAQARFVAAPAEDTGLEPASFDLVVGKWVLHHIDLATGAAEIRRLLRPGGRGVFVETSGLNPLLRLARRRLTGRMGVARYGTPDERPISKSDLRLLDSAFPRCAVDFPNFVFFFLIDRHLLKWRSRRLSRVCRGLDQAVESRAPRLGRWSYYLRVIVEA